MGKESILLNSWLDLNQTSNLPDETPPDSFSEGQLKKSLFDQYLTPGWTGDSLNSKQALAIKHLLDQLKEEAKNQFFKLQGFNKSLKVAIYNEFLKFSLKYGEECQEIGNYIEFFRQIEFNNSPHRLVIKDFIETYSFRAASTYLLKVRFIVFLSHESKIQLSKNHLLNPLTFITSIFKKGSSSELPCDSMQRNHYSWFRPPLNFRDRIFSTAQKFLSIPVTEIFKIFQEPLNEIDKISGKQDRYAHTLSHKAFGNFLNKILIHLPPWINPDNGGHQLRQTKLPYQKQAPANLNSKITGDNLSSLILSHWLAQEINLKGLWQFVLTPDFIGSEEDRVAFLKITNELQLLTLIVQLAKEQNYDPISLIGQVMREKNAHSVEESNGQMSMFTSTEIRKELLYKRIVINLTKLPKKNPHHYLLNRVNQEIKFLHRDGLIYVFSNQNLFVPSQSDKVEQFLKKLKLEASFNFESLKGRGEIPSNLYIFSSRKLKEDYLSLNNTPSPIESCLTFRWSGYLSSFHKFSDLVFELENIFKTKNPHTTPLYQEQISDDVSFEFHQDAILEGKLLHSNNQDPTKITHPSFFRNLAKSCFPFDQFFTIESINVDSGSSAKGDFTSSLLGLKFKKTENYPYVVIIDYRNQTNINLELISGDSYKAEVEKYGTAFFQYFGLMPKRPDLNINVFREYFKSDIGHQILQISLNGGLTKVKSKLRALLIPKFFFENSQFPEGFLDQFNVLKTSKEAILETHPNDLETLFFNTNQLIEQSIQSHPHQILCLLAYFKQNIEDCIKKIDSKESEAINYHNPLILDPLLSLELSPVLNNKEVYIEFKSKNIQLPLTKVVVKTNEEDEIYLSLLSNKTEIIEVYSSKEMITFLQFLVEPALNYPILEILRGLQIPKTDQLNKVIAKFKSMEKALIFIHGKVQKIISKTLFHQISSSSK
ncbi:hypothetical protein OAK75_13130 [Bacteriovoracales bacterium]|nr:hypothetical protein [Bacteriovoracales bacterium]